MSGFSTIGAHVALTGIGAFDGNVRQVIYGLDLMTRAAQKMSQQSESDFNAQAAAAAKGADLTAKAAESEAARVAAAADAQAAAVSASVDRQIADQAKLTAAMALAQAQRLNAVNPRSLNMLGAGGTQVPNSATAMAVQTADQAAALEKQAQASEAAAAAAASFAATQTASAAQAEEAVAAFAASSEGELAAVGTAFAGTAAISTAAMFAIIAAVTLGIAALAAFSVAAIKMAGDYDQNLNTVQALTEETNGRISDLSLTIRDLGTHSLSGMMDVSKGALELARSGVSVDTAMQGALKSVVNLVTASAGELSFADAAKAVATGIAAFNLEGSQSVDVADAITATAQRTVATYGDLAHSLAQVGTVAHSLNFSIGDTTDALGLLSLNAIKGSDAGTSLRAMFQQLEHPTKNARQAMQDYHLSLYDSAGAARPLRDIIINLEQAFGAQEIAAHKLTEEQRDLALATLFGRDGQRASLALINEGVEGYDRLAQAQQELTAQSIADKMLVPLNAQLVMLGNNVQAATLAIGQSFEPAMQKAAGAALEWLQGINANTSGLTVFGDAVSALVTGNGFDALYTKVTDVFGPNTGNAIIEIINIVRNLGDSLAQYIGPALDHLGTTIHNAFPTVDLDKFAQTATGVSYAINLILTIVAGTIDNVANLISLFSNLSNQEQSLNPLVQVFNFIARAIAEIPLYVNAALDALINLPPIGAAIGELFSNIGSLAQRGLSAVGTAFDSLSTATREFFDNLGTMINNGLNALAPLEPVLLALATPFLLLVALVSALADAFVNAGGTIEAIISGFGDSFNALGDEFKIIPDAAEGSIAATNSAFEEGFGNLLSFIGNFAGTIGDAIGRAFDLIGTTAQAIVVGLGDSFASAGDEVTQLWTGLWTWVVQFFDAAINLIVGLINEFGKLLGAGFAAVGTIVTTIWGETWEGVVDLFNRFVGVVTSNISSFMSSLGASFVSAGTSIGNIWHDIWQGLVSIVTSALNALGEKLNGFFNALKASPVGTFIEGAIGGFEQFGDNAVAAMGAVGNAVDGLQSNFQAMLADFKSGLNSIQSPFEGISRGGVDTGVGSLPARGNVGGGGPSTDASPPDVGGGKPKKDKAAEDAAAAQKRLLEMYQDTMRQLANLQEDTLQKIDDAWVKHGQNWIEAVVDATDKIKDIYAKRDEEIANAQAEFDRNRFRQVVRLGLQQNIEDATTTRNREYEDQQVAYHRELDAEQRARTEERYLKEQAFSQQLDDQERAIKRAEAAQDVGIQRANQAAQTAMQEQQQIQQRGLAYMFEQANAARQGQYSDEDAARAQARQNAQAQIQFQRQLEQAKTPEDRAKAIADYNQQQQDAGLQAAQAAQDRAIAKQRKAADDAQKLQQQAIEDGLKRSQAAAQRGLSYSQQDASTARKNTQEDADVVRSRTNETKSHDFKRGLDDQDRIIKEHQDDIDRALARQHEDTERTIKRGNDKILRDLENQWAQEDYDAKIQKINDTAQHEVDKTNEALAIKLQKVDETLATELQKIDEGYEKQKRTIIQKWEDAWQELIDKSPGIEEQLNSLFADFMGNVSATDTLVHTLIDDLKTALNLQGQVGNNVPAPTTPAISNVPPTPAGITPPGGPPEIPLADQQPPAEFAPSKTFATGGIVGGKIGAPQYVIAHGGEAFLGSQNAYLSQYMPMLAQIASINSRAYTYTPPVPPAQTTNITYSVDASYSQVQSQASVLMDMQALATMTRR